MSKDYVLTIHLKAECPTKHDYDALDAMLWRFVENEIEDSRFEFGFFDIDLGENHE
jgi:hypothetical protein